MGFQKKSEKSAKISFFGPYCAISETLQNFNIFLEFFHFGTAQLMCQNKLLGVVGGVLGRHTLLIFQIFSEIPLFHV